MARLDFRLDSDAGTGPREGGALDFGRFTGERLHGYDVAMVLTQGQTGQVRGGWIREAEFGWPWQGGPGPVRSGLGWISRDEANPAMVGEAVLD